MSIRGAFKGWSLSLFPVSVLSTWPSRLRAADQTKQPTEGIFNTLWDRCHYPRQAHARGAETIADNNRRGTFLCGLFLLLTGVLMLGCAIVVTPLRPGYQSSMMKSDHGLVLGRVHLVWNGRE